MKNYYFLSLLIVVLLSSCSNDLNSITGKWVNKDLDPPPTTVTISIIDNIISVNHEWRLEYNEHINGGRWFSTGKGQQTHTHAQYDNQYMRVDGRSMIFSDDFTSLRWKGHTYYKVN